MRAVVVDQNGGPEVLRVAERADPEPDQGQILVEIAAAGVNFMDIYQRQGLPPYGGTLPYVPGAEGAGRVIALGPGVADLSVGDRVAWTGVPRSYAEQVVIPADRACRGRGGGRRVRARGQGRLGRCAGELCGAGSRPGPACGARPRWRGH
jgi:NADPH2:quinone reductase